VAEGDPAGAGLGAVDEVQVGQADTGRDPDLSRPRRRDRHLLDAELPFVQIEPARSMPGSGSSPNRATGDPLRTLYYVLIGDLAFGIARGWQLMNMRRTSVFSSLRTLARGDEADDDPEDPGQDQCRVSGVR
jgi:hypothetical protein